MRRAWVGVLTMAAALARPVSAQEQPDLVARGVQAYQDLDFDVAARLLRRALTAPAVDSLPDGERARALAYLGATERFRQRLDSAAAVFRRLVLLDPRYRPDPLVFPPEVTTLFESVRAQTKVVAIRLATDTAFSFERGSLRAWLFPSTRQEVAVRIASDDGRLLRSLYAGPIEDSLEVAWDGRDSSGAMAPAGTRVWLVAASEREDSVAFTIPVTPGAPQQPARGRPQRSLAGPLHPQAPALRAGASVVGMRARSQVNGGRVSAAGTVGGAFATGRFGRMDLEVQYLEGVLEPRGASSARREIVQGQLGLGTHAAPWLALHTAVRARTYITAAVTERWVVWLLGARAEAPIIGTVLRGHVGYWQGLALGVNVGTDGGRGARGGDVALTMYLPSRPWWVRLSYGLDRSVVASVARRETVEELTLTVGLAR